MYPKYIHTLQSAKRPVKHLSGRKRSDTRLYNDVLELHVRKAIYKYHTIKLDREYIAELKKLLHVKTMAGIKMKIKALIKERKPLNS